MEGTTEPQEQEPQEPQEPVNIQHMIDTLPEGWKVKTLKDENGVVRDAIVYDENEKSVAWMAADENGIITESDCKFKP
jgi:hypothetical protein